MVPVNTRHVALTALQSGKGYSREGLRKGDREDVRKGFRNGVRKGVRQCVRQIYLFIDL